MVIGAVWANSIGGQPIFDDHFLVVRQTCFRTLEGVLRIFRFEAEYACTYRPARYLSYATDTALFGGKFWGYHVGNIVRHALAAGIAGLLAHELIARARPNSTAKRAAWLAFAVAAIWALHPVQTDSVTYVSGRRDILAGAWTFASVWTALLADRKGGLWWLLDRKSVV